MIKIKHYEIKLIKIVLSFCLIACALTKDYLKYLTKKISLICFRNEPLIKIFIMTHKDFINFRYNSAYTIVADDKSELKNKYNLDVIFATEGKFYNKRRGYGELSKLYYIYQLYKKGEISSKYIGLNHYRRYFEFTDNIPDFEGIFKKYDIILGNRVTLNPSVRKRYCVGHICKNFDDSLDIIKKIKPDYFDTAIEFAKNNKIYYYNMFIMKKEDFYKYCEFIFDILIEFDKKYNFKSDEDVLNYTSKIFKNAKAALRQSRLQGFLSERLSNIFYIKNFKRIKHFKIGKFSNKTI